MEKTWLGRLDSYDKAKARDALERAVGALECELKPGMKVVVKANLLTAKHPDSVATTHPALLGALYELLTERGCEVLFGDSPGGPFNALRLSGVYDACGLAAALPKAALNFDVSVGEAYCESARVLKKLNYTKYIDQADILIDFAKLKTHGMMGFTGAVKNLFGIVPGTAKVEYHYRMPSIEAFADMLVDLAEFAKPRLSFVDAVVGMEGDGPSSGTPRFVGALVASTSPHCADIVASALMGLTPGKVPTLERAIARGLCPASLGELALMGEDVAALAVNDYKTIPPSMGAEMLDAKGIMKPIAALTARLFASRPKLIARECVGCAECARACPPKAIRMNAKLPSIDYDKCIRCFCCQELCPKNAMRIHRPLLVRIVK